MLSSTNDAPSDMSTSGPRNDAPLPINYIAASLDENDGVFVSIKGSLKSSHRSNSTQVTMLSSTNDAPSDMSTSGPQNDAPLPINFIAASLDENDVQHKVTSGCRNEAAAEHYDMKTELCPGVSRLPSEHHVLDDNLENEEQLNEATSHQIPDESVAHSHRREDEAPSASTRFDPSDTTPSLVDPLVLFYQVEATLVCEVNEILPSSNETVYVATHISNSTPWHVKHKKSLIAGIFVIIAIGASIIMGLVIQSKPVSLVGGGENSESRNTTLASSGAYSNDGTVSNAGLVRVYQWNAGSSTWIQLGQDIDGEAAFDESGTSLSLSSDGTIMAIGADGTASNAGDVRVYQWNAGSSTWTQLGQDIDGEAAGDKGGYSVSLSSDGTIVAIGAVYNYTDRTDWHSGHVRVHQWNAGSSTWTQLGQDIDGVFQTDQSGRSVSLSSDGTIVAIGAAHNCCGTASTAGHVRVYQWKPTSSTWTQLGQDIDGEAAGDYSGWSVSLSSDGTIVAIGAPFNGGTASQAGHVRVHQWNATSSTWTQLGQDIDGESQDDYSGDSVSLSSDGTILAIGAPGNDATAFEAGHVRVYKLDTDSMTWNQLGQDINGESVEGGDSFSGGSVSLSSDGTIVAIGARWNDGVAYDAGNVRVYQWDGSTSWIQLGQDIDGEAEEDYFGFSVSLSSDGSIVAIGAPNYDVG